MSTVAFRITLMLDGDWNESATTQAIMFAMDMMVHCRRIARDVRAAGGNELGAIAWEHNALGFKWRARELRYDAAGGRAPPGGWP